MENTLFNSLKVDIQKAYEEGVTLELAERLAAKCLSLQIQLSTELSTVDLNARMNKSGFKAIKAAVYLKAATSGDKKPTEAMLTALVDSDELVMGEQNRLDKAEVERNELQNAFDICKESHIYFRGVAKGRFE